MITVSFSFYLKVYTGECTMDVPSSVFQKRNNPPDRNYRPMGYFLYRYR